MRFRFRGCRGGRSFEGFNQGIVAEVQLSCYMIELTVFCSCR